jgi:hypothetical protein
MSSLAYGEGPAGLIVGPAVVLIGAVAVLAFLEKSLSRDNLFSHLNHLAPEDGPSVCLQPDSAKRELTEDQTSRAASRGHR